MIHTVIFDIDIKAKIDIDILYLFGRKSNEQRNNSGNRRLWQ